MKGGAGTGASLGAWWVANGAELNATLQTASLILGITIGVVSLVKLLKKKKAKHHEK